MKTALLALIAAVFAAPALAAIPPADAWEIGPVIKGRNYSHNMPPRPTTVREGFRIDFPWPDARTGHVHYVTFRHGPLEGARRIVMRYRVDAEPGVRFVPQEHPGDAVAVLPAARRHLERQGTVRDLSLVCSGREDGAADARRAYREHRAR